MLRVLVCDDSFGFPALVRQWLQSDDRFEHAGTASGGAELLELAATTPADLVLLDYVLPDVENPAALVAGLRERLPGVRIVLVSSLAAAELERAAAIAGVDGWLHKAVTAPAMADELLRVASA